MFLDHIALNVRDPEKMLAFYVDVLGLRPERAAAFRRGEVAFVSVRISADSIIDFFPPAMWNGEDAGRASGPGMNHFCLCVPAGEWEGFLGRLEAGGVAIEIGPAKRWGAHGDALSVYFHDPEGNFLEARHYPGEWGAGR